VKEASGCLLSSSLPGVPHPNGECRMCSGGKGGGAIDNDDHHDVVVFGCNSYVHWHRLMYHRGGTGCQGFFTF